ncbi:UDP-glycosyltransferase UGT5-like [Adelges cooleyi]|uniref:UDP-glycosyltransferase UGT5-like n=1 Tax=Adelges cooleyi TaxID=133065 RepID=UPI00217FECA5|nr:UDP-glycosyltransferase UGT5-like [Adelges cooleyi]
MQFLFCFVLIILFLHECLSFNVLAFLPTKARSHYAAFEPLLKELAVRGHNVTVLSPFPLENPPATYHHLQVELDVDDSIVNPLNAAKTINTLLIPFKTWSKWPRFTEKVISKPSVQNLIHSKDLNFDLVIFENFNHECFVTMGHKFQAPVVQIIPAVPNAGTARWHGNPYIGSYIPEILSGLSDHMTFAERLTNTVLTLMHTTLSSIFYLPKQRDLMDKYFNYTGWETRPSMDSMLKNVSLTLLNTHFSVGIPRPLVPTYVDVAGMHLKSASSLPKDLQDIMDNSPEGVIYFSFGSLIRLSQLPKDELEIFIRQFSSIKQKVLWKWESDEHPNFPQNVITRKWFPQADILSHPNCILFITHGGIHSTEEAIYFGVPMLAISLFGDQLHNSLVMQDRGAAIRIKYSEFTEQIFADSLNKMLNNKLYKDNAMRLSSIFHDQPFKSLEKAIYWIEYIVRHNGAYHLKSEASELIWYEFLLLDGLFLVIIVRIIITVLMWKVGKKLINKFWKKKTD